MKYLEPDDHRFTLTEAAQTTDVAESAIRNWMNREIASIGEKQPNGRWLFSARDIVKLAVVGDLTTITAMPLPDAFSVGDLVAGRLTEMLDLTSGEPAVVAALRRGECWPSMRIYVLNWHGRKRIEAYREERGEEVTNHYATRTHLVIPVEQICAPVALRLFELMEHDLAGFIDYDSGDVSTPSARFVNALRLIEVPWTMELLDEMKRKLESND